MFNLSGTIIFPVSPQVDTTHFGILKTQIISNDLTKAGKYTPAVVQLQDRPIADSRKGMSLQLYDQLKAYIRATNDDKGANYALNTVGAMWINNPPNAESIACQHNFVTWNTEQNNCAKLICFQNDDPFQYDPQSFNWFTDSTLFFKALAINLKGNFSKVGNGINCYIPTMARSVASGGTGELWLALDEIEEFPALPVTVTIKNTGQKATLYKYMCRGSGVWALSDIGEIQLVNYTTEYTDWHLNTVLPIP